MKHTPDNGDIGRLAGIRAVNSSLPAAHARRPNTPMIAEITPSTAGRVAKKRTTLRCSPREITGSSIVSTSPAFAIPQVGDLLCVSQAMGRVILQKVIERHGAALRVFTCASPRFFRKHRQEAGPSLMQSVERCQRTFQRECQ